MKYKQLSRGLTKVCVLSASTVIALSLMGFTATELSSPEESIVAPTQTDEADVTVPMVNLDDETVLVVAADDVIEALGVDHSLDGEVPDAYSVVLEEASGLSWVPLFRDNPSLKAELAEQSIVAPIEGTPVSDAVAVRISQFSEQQVVAAQSALEQLISDQEMQAGLVFDASLDGFAVSGPANTCAQLPAEQDGVGLNCTVVDSAGRGVYVNGTPAPFRGGTVAMGQRLGFPSTSPYDGRCTTGIPARLSNGTVGMFTAGHCFRLTSHVFNNTNLNGGSNIGRVSHSYSYPAVDAQFISGKTYLNRIFVGNGQKPIIGSYSPPVGSRVCFQGSTSNYNCTNVVRFYGGTFCDGDGCSKNLMAISGGQRVLQGDSGGPAYVNFGTSVKVSGLTTAYSGGYSFITPWSVVSSRYSASLL